MDWSKAKNILIAALLATNLMLLFLCVARETEQARGDDDTLRDMLTAANILIETALPKRPGRMAVLYVQPEPEKAEQVAAVLRSDVRVPDAANASDADIRVVADAALRDCGYMTENVAATEIRREGQTITALYGNRYGGIPVEESGIACVFEDGRLASVSRKWYTPLALHNRKGVILTPLEALARLPRREAGSEPLIVREMEIVYRVNPDRSEAAVGDTALPAWKVTDATGEVFYIGAYGQPGNP